MIQVSRPRVSDQALRNVCDALASGWLSPYGSWYKRFRCELEETLGAGVVLTNSGTSALEVGLEALGTILHKRGGHVIVPAYTCPDSMMAVLKAGFTPVVCDVDKQRLCVTAEMLRAAVTTESVGVMPIHVYGMMCDLSVYQLARDLGLFIIDDACEAFGGTVGGLALGDLSDVQAYSLRGEKHLAVGTGGVLASRHPGIIGVADAMVGLNSASGPQRYYALWRCLSYEYHEVLCALASAQLCGLADEIAARWRVVEWYRAAGLHDWFVADDQPWKYPIWMGNATTAQETLRLKGIETSPPFTPLHKLPWPDATRYVCRDAVVSSDNLSLPSVEEVAQHVVALPLHSSLTENDVQLIVEALGGAGED